MHCASCSIRIDGDLEETNGVISSITDYHKAHGAVEFDETKVTEQEILTVIKNAGYEAEII